MKAQKALLQAVKIVVSLGLIIFLVVKISPGRLATQLRQVDPFYIAAAIAVFFLSSLLGSVQWHLLLRAGGISLPYRTTFRLYFVGLFFNNFLPANVGGDAVKIFDVARVGNDPHQVFAVTLLDRVIGITGLCILALTASFILLPGSHVVNLKIYIVIFAGCMVPVLALALNRRLSHWVRRLFSRIRLWGLGRRFEMIFDHLHSFRSLRLLLGKTILLSLVIQFMRVATHILVGRSLGIEFEPLGLLYFYVFVPLLGLVMILPISINGLGVREGTGVLLFTNIGLSEEQAVLMEFITYAVMVAVSLMGGFFFLRRNLRRD